MTLKTQLVNVFLPIMILVGLWPAMVFGNGSSVEVIMMTEGPYEIFVGIIPSPPVEGVTHLTVTVTDVSTSLPVTDADVEVLFHKQGEDGNTRAKLFNSPASPTHYDRNVELTRAGLWLLTVNVNGRLGAVEVDFSLDVLEPPRSLSGGLTWVGVIAILILGSVYVRWSISRTNPMRRP